jgi:uncharacterized repeat protein (TIGR03803 family)
LRLTYPAFFFVVLFSTNAIAANGDIFTFRYKSMGSAPNYLISDAQGNLYGTTYGGGSDTCQPGPEQPSGCGVVFELSPDGNGHYSYSVLHAFQGGTQDGSGPSGLTLDSTGNLYGTTILGGAYTTLHHPAGGTVFELSPLPGGGWSEKILHSFQYSGFPSGDGFGPEGAVVIDHSGNLYGTTNGGGSAELEFGTVYRLSPDSNGGYTETILYNFGGGDGARPAAGLAIDDAGNLYGTTQSGGTNDIGTVFELVQNSDGSWTETVIHSFGGDEGFDPVVAPVIDSQGNLFGTTFQGGPVRGNVGTVFEMSLSGSAWTFQTLFSFMQDNDHGIGGPAGPTAVVLGSSSAVLYGITNAGGAYGEGVLYKLTQNGSGVWTEAPVHAFTGADDGSGPSALLFGIDGNLYGTALSGGSAGLGVVYVHNP